MPLRRRRRRILSVGVPSILAAGEILHTQDIKNFVFPPSRRRSEYVSEMSSATIEATYRCSDGFCE
jgi:hypothetical protein